MRKIIFINHINETFTPTKSGALATIIYETIRAGLKDKTDVRVITRASPYEPFDIKGVYFLKPVISEQNSLSKIFYRIERKITGWREFGHYRWAQRVAQAISQMQGDHAILVLMNEPELCTYLRIKFPDAFIVHWFQNQHFCKPYFKSRFARSADRIAAVSQFTANWVERFYELPPGRVHILPNGVDTNHFAPSYGKSNNRVVVNFLGRTGVEKGPDLLLRAALEATALLHPLRFDIQLVGSNHWDRFELDDYQIELSLLVKKLQDRGVDVRRTGHISRKELPSYISRADVHVVPARWDEPFGMATLEGMSCGLATIASNTGGTPEVIGDAGLFFHREDISSLSHHLTRIIRDTTMRVDYASRARKRSLHFKWENTAERLIQIIQQM